MKRIESEWRSYLQNVIPRDASKVQVEESRRAFYAGAVSLFHTINTMLSPDAEPTADDLVKMQEIVEEIEAYGTAFEAQQRLRADA